MHADYRDVDEGYAIYINGIMQRPTVDYIYRGNTIEFTKTPVSSDEIRVIRLHDMADVHGRYFLR